jgi:hypothetical protein
MDRPTAKVNKLPSHRPTYDDSFLSVTIYPDESRERVTRIGNVKVGMQGVGLKSDGHDVGEARNALLPTATGST